MTRTTIERVASTVVLVIVTACADKARPDYEKCMKLKESGDLDSAASACRAAMEASSRSPSGIAAAREVEQIEQEIERQIEESVPPTVTSEWCKRLGARMDSNLFRAWALTLPARKQEQLRGVDLRDRHIVGGQVAILRDTFDNMLYNCHHDVGQPTSGRWLCRWNSTNDFNAFDKCDDAEAAKGDNANN